MNATKKLLLTGVAAVGLHPSVTHAVDSFTDYTGLDGGGWTVDYVYHVQNSQNLSGGVPYSTDNSASIATGSFDRVAYVMELQSGTAPTQYVFASFDAAGFSTDPKKLGVPTAASGEIYQQNVNNLHVLKGGGAVVTSGVFAGSSGNVEFWPNDYGQNNANGVPGASSGTYDTGDERAGGGTYGSMQIHNHNTGGANEVLFAFNQWNGGGELGIGNRTTGDPDWTFSGNAGSYNVKDIQVLVHATPEPGTIAGLGVAGLALLARRRTR